MVAEHPGHGDLAHHHPPQNIRLVELLGHAALPVVGHQVEGRGARSVDQGRQVLLQILGDPLHHRPGLGVQVHQERLLDDLGREGGTDLGVVKGPPDHRRFHLVVEGAEVLVPIDPPTGVPDDEGTVEQVEAAQDRGVDELHDGVQLLGLAVLDRGAGQSDLHRGRGEEGLGPLGSLGPMPLQGGAVMYQGTVGYIGGVTFDLKVVHRDAI